MVESKRNSSIELLKIIAIICIIFCHSIPSERVEYHFASSDPCLFIIMLLRHLGSVGNAIFIVASAWFLTEDNRVNFIKINKIIADNQVISIICLILSMAVLGGYSIAPNTVIMQLFPFSYSSLWYVTCYVLYYLLHGILNRGVDIPGKQKNILMIITIVYLVMVFLTNRFYSNELICFCAIHILSYCIKNYLAQKNKLNRNTGIVLFAIGLFAWLGGAIVFNAIGVKFPSIGNKFHLWNRFYNPFILILAYGSIIIASSRSFGSDIINKLSSYSLYIYMFTGNQMIRTYLDNAAYDKVSVLMGPSTLVCLLFIIAYSIIKAFAGIFLSSIYKYTFGKIVTFVIKGETYIAKKIVEKV